MEYINRFYQLVPNQTDISETCSPNYIKFSLILRETYIFVYGIRLNGVSLFNYVPYFEKGGRKDA